jgi:hypothetical protein
MGCTSRNVEYSDRYSYLEEPIYLSPFTSSSDYYLVILVTARHLDYSNSRSFLKTIAKHPSNGTKNGDVGHTWIYLHGIEGEKEIVIEGGHSGELGILQPRYWEGVLNYALYGYCDPTPEQQRNPCIEPNPIKYLWEMQKDGYFQCGSGGHSPTFAAKINLTQQQFTTLRHYIDPTRYPYHEDSLAGRQCSSFVAEIAALAGLPIEHQVTLYIQPTLTLGKQTFTLWEEERYSHLTFSSPDRIEQSLIEAVKNGQAENALSWYRRHHPQPASKKFAAVCENLRLFPYRLERRMAIR